MVFIRFFTAQFWYFALLRRFFMVCYIKDLDTIALQCKEVGINEEEID